MKKTVKCILILVFLAFPVLSFSDGFRDGPDITTVVKCVNLCSSWQNDQNRQICLEECYSGWHHE